MRSRFPRTLKPAPLLAALCLTPAAALAQARGPAEKPAVFCEPSRAVALVREQLTEAKAFDNPVKRIGVMTRAADLLWAGERAQARAVFAEAFELASRHYRERGDEVRREAGRADSRLPGLVVQLPDQRFVVLRAVAKRDPAWARELAARAADETREEAKRDEAAAKGRLRPVGEKLLPLAEALLETDRQTALAVARSTFADPATMYLPRFLYVVAESDRAAADALFRDALAAYAARDDVNSLLYLSYYPFALNQPIASVTPNAFARPSAGFRADPELQRLFAEAFLGFARRRLAALTEQPPAEEPSHRRTEPEAIFTALKVLEALYGAGRPAVLERITAMQGQAVTLLTPARQRSAAAYSARDLDADPTPREGAFEASLEQAEKIPPDRRDMYLSGAVLFSSDAAPLEKVEAAARKMEDAEARRQVLNWLYFRRGQKAARGGDFDEARRLAELVEPLEGRALLLLTIASEGLKRSDDKQRAEELLSAVVAAARKAPDTEAKARSLLGVAHLYARFDYLRGLAVMGEAVSAVGKLSDPDLASATLRMMVQGKNFNTHAAWPMPSFTLESSFGELGARDFEATLAHANQLGDKYLRATAVLSLAAGCLEDAERLEKAKKPTAAPRQTPAPKKRP